MLAQFTKVMNDAVENVQHGFISSLYNKAENLLNIYFLNERVGYVEIVHDENVINYYALRDGQPVLLDNEPFEFSVGWGYLDKQAAYAEKLAFDDLFKRWLAEQD